MDLNSGGVTVGGVRGHHVEFIHATPPVVGHPGQECICLGRPPPRSGEQVGHDQRKRRC